MIDALPAPVPTSERVVPTFEGVGTALYRFYSNGLNGCGPNLGVPNGGPSLFV